jgi:hypothetical protein
MHTSFGTYLYNMLASTGVILHDQLHFGGRRWSADLERITYIFILSSAVTAFPLQQMRMFAGASPAQNPCAQFFLTSLLNLSNISKRNSNTRGARSQVPSPPGRGGRASCVAQLTIQQTWPSNAPSSHQSLTTPLQHVAYQLRIVCTPTLLAYKDRLQRTAHALVLLGHFYFAQTKANGAMLAKGETPLLSPRAGRPQSAFLMLHFQVRSLQIATARRAVPDAT